MGVRTRKSTVVMACPETSSPAGMCRSAARLTKRCPGLVSFAKTTGALMALLVVASSGAILSASAQDDPQTPAIFGIGYVHLDRDPRQNAGRAYYRIPAAPLGSAVFGAEVAIVDSRLIAREINVDFQLQVAQDDNLDNLLQAIETWASSGIGFVIADLPAPQLAWLAEAAATLPVTILNISAIDDSLRGEGCRRNLFHVIPSQSMLTDAIAQFLAQNRWRDVLVLRGPLPEDFATVDAFSRSADRAGIKIVETRDFVLIADPRNRDASNVALLTAGIDYDVVFVADALGEFASTVPFRTREARPVVGAAGLVPEAWHWAWERAGAPQLNARFEFQAGRRMGAVDWAAWVSVRALVQSALRAQSTDHDVLRAHLLSEQLNLDGAKGTPLSIRSWDQQFRQPVLLATNNSIVALAPLEGFVHPTNDLDTLGAAEAGSQCVL